MGNTESMYESEDNFYQHAPYYAGSLENSSYHESSSYDGDYSNTSYNQPSTYARSSENSWRQKKQQPTYIADHFSSLDQVSTANFAWFYLY